MDMLKGMNQALAYIEEHLEAEIDLKEVAKQAYSSEFHFKRLFSLLAGITIGDYIRRRRLTKAAMDLRDSRQKVIDVALKYGYQSPDAFTRAFQNFHGVLPSQASDPERMLKAYPKLAFQLTIQGGIEMKYRLTEKEAFTIIGVKYDVEMVDEVLTPTYDAMITNIDEDTFAKLAALSDREPFGIVHASAHYKEDGDGKAAFQQYIGAATTQKATGKFETLAVPRLQWAIFEVEGEWHEIEEQWMRIYTEWLPASSYQLAAGPELFVNGETSEVWIPVRES